MTEPLPPNRPFTAAEALALGMSRVQLRRLVECGAVTQILYGVYVPGSWPDTPISRARAAALVLPDHCVIADRSASSLHGIDVLEYAELDVPPDLEVVSVGGAPTRRAGVLGGKRDLTPDEIMSVGGVPVTTPLRTACDIGCLRGRHRAIATLDAFRTRFNLTAADFMRVLPRFKGRRGVKQLKELIPLSRRGVDSQPESWIGIDLYDEGYPRPAAQVWVFVPGWGMAKVENAYEHLRIGVEYDGDEHHSSDEDIAHDEARRAALRRAGWIIIVVRKDGFTDPGRARWLAEFAQAYADRAPNPPRRRVYARGPDQMPRRRRR